MIKGVVSDFGGVLTIPLREAFKAYHDASGVSAEELGKALARAAERDGEHPLFRLERGELTEAEFGAILSAELPHGFDLEELRGAYFERLEPNTPMIEFMRDLRGRGLRLAMCTNNVREWEPLWRSKIPELDEIFEAVVDSGFVGTRKPERKIYDLTLEAFGDGFAFEDLVLVDDIDVNCEAAIELGMKAVRFETTEQAIKEIEASLELRA